MKASVLFWVVGSPLHLCLDVLLGKSKLCTMLVNTLTKLSNLFAKHIFNETHNGHCTCYQWDQDILTRQKNRFINLLLIYRFDMTWILLYDNINFPFLIIIVFTLTYNFYCYYKNKSFFIEHCQINVWKTSYYSRYCLEKYLAA